MEQKASSSQGKVKGSHWRYNEIRDVLDIWGQKKVQDALRAVHKNIDVFEGIAEQMRERGHNRNAEDCRNKTKAMRLEFKKVVAHNKCSGNAPKTCAFYNKLENILRGDASIDPPRLSRSCPFRREELPLTQDMDATTLEETCSLESVLETQASAPSLIAAEEETKGKVLEPVSVKIPPALLESPPKTPLRNEAEGVEHPATAALSAGTRLRHIRTRRQGGRRGENIAIAIMQNANNQAKLQCEAMQEDAAQDRQILLSICRSFEEDRRVSQQRFDVIEKLLHYALEQSRVEKQCCTETTACTNTAVVQEHQKSIALAWSSAMPKKRRQKLSRSGSTPKKLFLAGKTRIPPPSQTDLEMASTNAICYVQPLPDCFRGISQGETPPISNPVTAYIMETAFASSQLDQVQIKTSETLHAEDTEGTRKGERERKKKKQYTPE